MQLIVLVAFGLVAAVVYYMLWLWTKTMEVKASPLPAAGALAVMAVAVLVDSSMVMVPFGSLDIVTFNGALTDRVLDPGLNFKWPLINGVYPVNTQMRALKITNDQVFTRDLQNADNDYVINFSLDDSKLINIVSQFKGDDGRDTSISERLIEPRASYWLKQIEPNYNAAVLLQNRARVATNLQTDLDRDLKPYGVRMAFVSITNITFGPQYQQASEARAAAEQEYQRELTVLNTKRVLAQQEVTIADGDRKAEELRREGLGSDPHIAADLVSLTFIEHMTKDNGWDGRVPQMLGGGSGLMSLDGGSAK
ncbi:MAG: prohibitin family protein [Vulcanimicrobiaceae bacterium]|jgi:regulator of protease activity HflC (stomatin/prohibitin superfamily)